MTEPTTPSPEKAEFTDAELKVIAEHAGLLRPYLRGDRILREYLVIAFALGVIAHVVGYLLRVPLGEPFRLVADLVYELGGALWTGVVVVFFVQIFPESKRRELQRALAAVAAGKGRKDEA